MPNLYEKVLAIPDSTPGAFSGALPAGSVSGYPPAIPSGQILIPTGANMGVWNVQAGAWVKENHAPGVSVQVKVTQGDLAGWHVLQPGGTAFSRV